MGSGGTTDVVFVAGAWGFLRAVIKASIAEHRLLHCLDQNRAGKGAALLLELFSKKALPVVG